MTCDQPSYSDGRVTIDRCSELKYAPSQASDLIDACRRASGTVSFEACRRTGALGRCDIPEDKGVSSSVYLFRDDLVQSSTGAKAACGAMGGSFSAVIETVPDNGSGRSPGGSGGTQSLCVPPTKARSTAQAPYYSMSAFTTPFDLTSTTEFAIAFTNGAVNILWLGGEHCLTGIVYAEAGYNGTAKSSGDETVQTSSSTLRFASANTSEAQGVSLVTNGKVDLELFVDGVPATEIYLYDGASGPSVPVTSPVAVIEN